MKLKVFSISDFELVLKGLLRITTGTMLVVNNTGTKISANSDSKIRAFINTESLKLISDNDADEVELCFENLAMLLKAIMFIKEIGGSTDTAEFECDGVFLKYSGKGSIKLKLDKRERIEQFLTTPIKAELKNLFAFELTDASIKQILKYSQFNTNYDVKLYFYLGKDQTLMVDIDDKKEMAGRLSKVSIPVTKKYKGILDKPFILCLEDIQKFNIFDQEKIQCCLTDKCLKIATEVSGSEIDSNMVAIVRILTC